MLNIPRRCGRILAAMAGQPLWHRVCFWLPPVGIAFYIYFFGVNILIMDEFELVRLFDTPLSWKMFFSQHNEHRILVAKLLTYAVGRATAMSSVALMFVSLAFLTTAYVAIVASMKDALREDLHPLYILCVGLLVFSPVQCGNLLWAFQLNNFTAYAFSVMALYCLSRAVFRHGSVDMLLFIAALSCAVAASFSSSQGLFSWLAVSLIWTAYKQKTIVKDKLFWIWNAAALATWSAYFATFVSPGGSHMFWNADPLACIRYAFTLLGMCLLPDTRIAWIPGMVICGACVMIGINFLRSRDQDSVFPLGLIAYGFMIAATITLGRAGLGPEPSPGYTTWTLCIVIGISIYALCALLKTTLSMPYKIAYPIILCLIVVSIPIQIHYGIRWSVKTKSIRLMQKLVLQTYDTQPSAALLWLYPGSNRVKHDAMVLKKMKYNAFSDDTIIYANMRELAKDHTIITDSDRILTGFDADSAKIIQDKQDPYIQFSSWIVDAQAKDTIKELYIALNDDVYPAFYGLRRRDIAKLHKQPRYAYSGYTR
jgi:hypothetical protein